MAPKQKPKARPGTGSNQDQQQRADLQANTSAELAASVEGLIAELDKHIKANDLKQVLKTADEILAILPQDQDALQSKVVAFIQMDQLENALSFIESVAHLPIDFQFHKAYCLYRLNQLDEALKILQGLDRSPDVLQLEGQILYRKNDMDSCIRSFEDLISKFKVDSVGAKTNVTAAFISAGRSSEVSTLMGSFKISAASNFELAYNTACALIEKGEFTEAQQSLLRARTLGQEMLTEEDYTEEEIESELSPITVQLAYVQQVLGNHDEAMSAYSNILARKQADTSSLAVATNNLIALKGTKEVHDGIKKIDKFLNRSAGGQIPQFAEGLDLKLSSRQKEAVFYNRALLLIYANKLDQARELVSGLVSTSPDNLSFALLQAALLVRENKNKKAEETLYKFAESHAKDSKSAYLACAQIAASAGHFQVAADSLQKIPDIQNQPATVATLVALKEKGNDIDGAEAVLDAAVDWWKNSMEQDPKKLELIMHEAALFKFKHNKVNEASGLFEQLVKGADSQEVREEALVGLVRTTAKTDLAKAEFYVQQLPPIPGLSRIDINALEQTSGPNFTSTARHIHNHAEDDKNKSEKKRKRKPRYPKGYDPANPGPPPDPERWLPKRERSSYRPRRKDRRAAQIRGSQGAVAREKPDHSSSVNGSTAKSSTASANPEKGSSANVKPSTQKNRRKSRR